MQKIRRDDEIIVIAGKDKGKRGKVLKVLADDRVIVGEQQQLDFRSTQIDSKEHRSTPFRHGPTWARCLV